MKSILFKGEAIASPGLTPIGQIVSEVFGASASHGRTLSKDEIETIAAKVAAILEDQIGGGPTELHSWLGAGDGICDMTVIWETPYLYGDCITESHDDMDAPSISVRVLAKNRRDGTAVRTIIHELAHAVLRHFSADVFTETPWITVDYAYQATENICRAVERHFLGSFGRGWLPAHGFYWH